MGQVEGVCDSDLKEWNKIGGEWSFPTNIRGWASAHQVEKDCYRQWYFWVVQMYEASMCCLGMSGPFLSSAPLNADMGLMAWNLV